MKIDLLTTEKEEAYSKFVSRNSKLIFPSLKYRNLLMDYFHDSSFYLLAMENETIRGILPCFIHENRDYGNVLNSLPFYGSNGGIIADCLEAKTVLLDAYRELASKNGCVASTLITSPFCNDEDFYELQLTPDFIDRRIGQISIFEKNKIIDDVVDDELLFHVFQKVRKKNIYRARNHGVSIGIDNTKEGFDFLFDTHVENMKRIGGIAKKKDFFNCVERCLVAGVDYDLYVGYMEGKRIAACLLLYFNETVEYFCPVTLEEYRTEQPLSLILFTAIKDSIKAGKTVWNWGGTGLSQEGVYMFKASWGAKDISYYYYTNIYDESILRLNREEILNAFPNYYVFPFDRKKMH